MAKARLDPLDYKIQPSPLHQQKSLSVKQKQLEEKELLEKNRKIADALKNAKSSHQFIDH